jgi:hypothetical protein
VLGNPESYADYARNVVIVTPEKLYEPKRESIHILKIENKRRLENLELRKKVKDFLLILQ